LRGLLWVLPIFVVAWGFASAEAADYEADDFFCRGGCQQQQAGGTSIVATNDRDAFQLASALTIILRPDFVALQVIRRIGCR
jgi:DNA polymerase-1